MAYSFEMVMVGMILLSAMVAGGIALAIRRRREARMEEFPGVQEGPEDGDDGGGGGGGTTAEGHTQPTDKIQGPPP